MARIFISYKRADRDKVIALKQRIESTIGVKCWIDLEDIRSDEHFKKVIIEAINQAEIVIFVYSHHHLYIRQEEKDWTLRELNFAERKKKRIIFYNLDGSPLSDVVSFDYSTKQQIDGRSEEANIRLMRDLQSWLSMNPIQSQHYPTYNPYLQSNPTLHPISKPLSKPRSHRTLWIVLGVLLGLILTALFVAIVLIRNVPDTPSIADYGWKNGDNYVSGVFKYNGEDYGFSMKIEVEDEQISSVYYSPDAEEVITYILGEGGFIDNGEWLYIDGSDSAGYKTYLKVCYDSTSEVYSGVMSRGDHQGTCLLQLVK